MTITAVVVHQQDGLQADGTDIEAFVNSNHNPLLATATEHLHLFNNKSMIGTVLLMLMAAGIHTRKVKRLLSSYWTRKIQGRGKRSGSNTNIIIEDSNGSQLGKTAWGHKGCLSRPPAGERDFIKNTGDNLLPANVPIWGPFKLLKTSGELFNRHSDLTFLGDVSTNQILNT